MRRMFSKKQIEAIAEAVVELNNPALALLSVDDGNILVDGGLTVDGPITGDSIIENMSGYSCTILDSAITANYVGIVKNGNKLTIVVSGVLAHTDQSGLIPCQFNIPKAVWDKLYPAQIPDTSSTDILSHGRYC